MAEERTAKQLVEQAERAAIAGDLAAADESLRAAARIQEAELGPVHPDLTSTLNNLAIVAEKAGRFGDAETFYRRAAAIASASLPPDHPRVADTRNNLEDFCRERGLPIAPPVQATQVRATPAQATPTPPAARKAQGNLPWLAAGIILGAVIVGVLLMRRNSPSPEAPGPVGTTTEAARPTEAPTPPVAAPALGEKPAARNTAPPRGEPPVSPQARRVAAPISLGTVQLCKTFSTREDRWTCDPADDPAARGRIVLYTRVKSPRDTTVVHRWYQGGELRQSVRLDTRASVTEGYRTYSQLTINSPGKWRVEVRSADGDLLFEKPFAVR
jgi:Protein of unknown function (DUF2914)/Tetratricopeptide repeat